MFPLQEPLEATFSKNFSSIKFALHSRQFSAEQELFSPSRISQCCVFFCRKLLDFLKSQAPDSSFKLLAVRHLCNDFLGHT